MLVGNRRQLRRPAGPVVGRKVTRKTAGHRPPTTVSNHLDKGLRREVAALHVGDDVLPDCGGRALVRLGRQLGGDPPQLFDRQLLQGRRPRCPCVDQRRPFRRFQYRQGVGKGLNLTERQGVQGRRSRCVRIADLPAPLVPALLLQTASKLRDDRPPRNGLDGPHRRRIGEMLRRDVLYNRLTPSVPGLAGLRQQHDQTRQRIEAPGLPGIRSGHDGRRRRLTGLTRIQGGQRQAEASGAPGR